MTLDYLYDFDGIFVETEVVMPISHQLMIHPDNTEIEKIYSHPQALAQCYHFLDKEYKDVIKQELVLLLLLQKEWPKILKKICCNCQFLCRKIIRTENHSPEYSRY